MIKHVRTKRYLQRCQKRRHALDPLPAPAVGEALLVLGICLRWERATGTFEEDCLLEGSRESCVNFFVVWEWDLQICSIVENSPELWIYDQALHNSELGQWTCHSSVCAHFKMCQSVPRCSTDFAKYWKALPYTALREHCWNMGMRSAYFNSADFGCLAEGFCKSKGGKRESSVVCLGSEVCWGWLVGWCALKMRKSRHKHDKIMWHTHADWWNWFRQRKACQRGNLASAPRHLTAQWHAWHRWMNALILLYSCLPFTLSWLCMAMHRQWLHDIFWVFVWFRMCS